MVKTLLARVVCTAYMVTLSATVVSAQVAVEGLTIKQRPARPGDTYSGTFAIKNTTSETQEARLYQTDYSTSAAGEGLYGEPGSLPRSNARWVKLGSSRVVLPPNQTVEVPYTVSVPAGPLVGTFWSLVMVEAIPRGSPESAIRAGAQTPAPRTLGITMRFRTAIQMVTDIEAGATREVKFETPQVFAATQDSAKGLQVDLRNTGTLAFSPLFTLELYGADGAHVRTVTARRAIIYPGTSLRQLFDLGRLAAGKYKAVVTVDAGANAVFGAQYSFTF